MEIMPGPDFPTGGIVEGKKQIKEAFETGKGKIVVKSKYEYVKEKGKEQIIITEIPYEVNKAILTKKINDIRNQALNNIQNANPTQTVFVDSL